MFFIFFIIHVSFLVSCLHLFFWVDIAAFLSSGQIQIPPQTEEVHWLHFSPVEGHFYHRQHEVCSRDALVKLRKISDWSLKLGSLDRRTVDSILYPLLRLRQACCHPQAVRGEFLPLQKR